MGTMEKAQEDLRARLNAMAQLKIFLVGLSQMTGLPVKVLASMAAEIAEIAEKTGGDSLKISRQ